MARIIVVGLGPAGSEFLTADTAALLTSGKDVWLRTNVHPAAAGLVVSGSFDELYESVESFDQLYPAIVERVVGTAVETGEVVYAVPGSPTVAERTVELLRVHPQVVSGEIELDIRPAMAFTDLCWNALGVDPMAEAATIVDALSLSDQIIGLNGPLLVTQVHAEEVLDDLITLLDDVAPDHVTILKGLGTQEEVVKDVAWAELRSHADPDHLTTLWIPRLTEPLGAGFTRLDEAIREVRNSTPETVEDAWRTLRAQLPVAANTVVDAIDALLDDAEDAALDFEDSLADLLYQIVLASRSAAQSGLFTISDLAETAHERHR